MENIEMTNKTDCIVEKDIVIVTGTHYDGNISWLLVLKLKR